jgi:ATP-binding cassette, subfamily B, bacterial
MLATANQAPNVTYLKRPPLPEMNKNTTTRGARLHRVLSRHVLQRTCRADARRYLVCIVALQLVAAVLTIAELALLRRTVETMQNDDGITSHGSTRIAIVVAIHLFAGFISALASELRSPLAESVHRTISLEIADVASRVPLPTLEDPDFHNRLQRIVGSAQERIWGVVFGGVSLLQLGLTTLAIGIALATLAPIVLPIALLSVVPLLLAFRKNTRASHDLAHQLTESDRRREYLENILTSVGAAKEVRAFNLGPLFARKIAEEFEIRRRQTTQVMRSRIRRTALSNIAAGICVGGGLAAVVFASQNQPLSAGVVTATAFALYQLLGRLRSITSMTESFQHGRLYLLDYIEFLQTPLLPDSQPAGLPGVPGVPEGSFAVDDVEYTYPGASRPAVTGICFRVDPGSMVAIIGDNGSGKSTLVKLMCGLIVPTVGSIRVGDTNLQDLGHPLPLITSVMFQDYVRFELSLEENVTVSDWADPSPTSRAQDAATRAGLGDIIRTLTNGTRTVLSRTYADGTDLSIGQWQRVALARALFRRSRFLLLDEPTASLDALAEDSLLASLDELRKDRGVVLITHRLSTARHADEILVMDAGKIVERGTHDFLMDLGGLYATRFNLQARPYAVVRP